eukprot:6179815-Amphidinium_carterae.1
MGGAVLKEHRRDYLPTHVIYSRCFFQESCRAALHWGIVRLTNEQASVLLACGEYWSWGLIPEDVQSWGIPQDVFLDMLAGLPGLRGEQHCLQWEEQLAASLSSLHPGMVDVEDFVKSHRQGWSMQSEMKALFSSLSRLSSSALTSMCQRCASASSAKGQRRGGGRSRSEVAEATASEDAAIGRNEHDHVDEMLPVTQEE